MASPCSDVAQQLTVYTSPAAIAVHEPAWNALAERAGDPFLTQQWLRSWWRAFAPEDGIAVAQLGDDGVLEAAACLRRSSERVVHAAANDYTESWDVLAVDDSSRRAVWDGV